MGNCSPARCAEEFQEIVMIHILHKKKVWNWKDNPLSVCSKLLHWCSFFLIVR